MGHNNFDINFARRELGCMGEILSCIFYFHHFKNPFIVKMKQLSKNYKNKDSDLKKQISLLQSDLKYKNLFIHSLLNDDTENLKNDKLYNKRTESFSNTLLAINNSINELNLKLFNQNKITDNNNFNHEMNIHYILIIAIILMVVFLSINLYFLKKNISEFSKFHYISLSNKEINKN